jgi:hypothetical protein
MRRHLPAAAVLLVVVGLGYLAAVRSARPRVIARVDGRVLSPPSGEGQWVGWLEGDAQKGRLVAARRRGGRARIAFSSAGLSGLALVGDSAFVSKTTKGEGGATEISLLRVDLADGTSAELVALGRSADQIVAGDGWLCWHEYWEAGLPGVDFVVAAAPLNVVRACPEAGGSVSTLAVLRADPLQVADRPKLVGIRDGRAYWLERRLAGGLENTVIRRAAVAGGEPETLLRERGRRTAALSSQALLWTAPSLEAAEPAGFAAVKRMGLDGGEPRVIGDWLEPGTTVLASDANAYAQGREWLWRLGMSREGQRPLHEAPRGLVTAAILGDQEYFVIRSAGGLAIARRPLTWWARVRGLFPA